MPSDGFRCDVCGDVHDTRADALRCCSDGFDDDDGLDPDDRLAMNAVDEHGSPTVISDGGKPSTGRIDPLVCPRGHHAVRTTGRRINCETCRNQGRETTTWDSDELVDLREEEPPLADDDDDDAEPRVLTDGGEDIEHLSEGFVSQEHLLDEHSPEPVPEREPRCTESECSNRGLDYCDCCGRHLCGRHNETQGGFCSDFTRIDTAEFGEVPCCPRVLPDGEPLVDANPQLIYPAETDTQERAQQAPHSELQAAVEAEMPGWQVRRARELLQEVREAVDAQRALAVHCETAATELRAWLRASHDRRADVQLARAVCRLDAAQDCLDEDDLGHAWEVREALDLLEDAVAITGGDRDV